MNRFVNIEILKFSRLWKMKNFKFDLQKISLQSDARVVTDPEFCVFECFPCFWTHESKQSIKFCVFGNLSLLHRTLVIKKTKIQKTWKNKSLYLHGDVSKTIIFWFLKVLSSQIALKNNLHFVMNSSFYLSKQSSFVHRKCSEPMFVIHTEFPIRAQSKQITSEVRNRPENIILCCQAISLEHILEFLLFFFKKAHLIHHFDSFWKISTHCISQ